MCIKWTVLGAILFSVLLSSVAQIVFKIGMSRNAITSAIGRGSLLEVAFLVVQNPWVIGGMCVYFLAAMIWLYVLARVEVSYAYPFVGIGFVLTMFLARSLIGDNISICRLVGTLLVGLGVALIARG